MASIDRNTISIEDTLTLTVRIAETGRLDGPDTSVLEKDFHVLGTTQSTRHSIMNGRSESSTEWNISLAAKRPGTLVIPPMKVGSETTQALTVVVNGATSHPQTGDEPVYIESEVSAENVYTQQQILFTVRVFQSIQLDNLSLSDFDIDGALIQKLEQNSFQRRMNNRIYRVHEINYAIFPQQAGSLTIPEVIFSANEIVSQRSIFSLPGQGRPLRRMTRQHDIKVLPPPKDFAEQSDNIWLPASDLQLIESWSSSPDTLKVGDSITRTITLKARGLIGAQLPPYTFATIKDARLYPDKGDIENALTTEGASAIRTDSAAIIPVKEGSLEIPPITLSWWDTDDDTIKRTTIAGRTIQVKPGSVRGDNTQASLNIDKPAPGAVSTAPVYTDNTNVGWWQITTLVFAMLWLGTVGMWWQAKRQPRSVTTPLPPTVKVDEGRAFKQLTQQIQSAEPLQIRKALISWAQLFWPDDNTHTLSDIQQRCKQPMLTTALQQLEQGLYGSSSAKAALDREALLNALKVARKQHNERRAGSSGEELPALYRL